MHRVFFKHYSKILLGNQEILPQNKSYVCYLQQFCLSKPFSTIETRNEKENNFQINNHSEKISKMPSKIKNPEGAIDLIKKIHSLDKISNVIGDLGRNREQSNKVFREVLEKTNLLKDQFNKLSNRKQIAVLYNLAKLKINETSLRENQRNLIKNFWNVKEFAISEYKTKDLLMYLWVAAKMEMENYEILFKIIETLLNSKDSMNEQDISTFLFSSAKLSEKIKDKTPLMKLFHENKEILLDLQKIIIKFLDPKYSQLNLVNMIWGAEKLQLGNDSLISKITDLLLVHKVNFDAYNFRILVNSSINLQIKSTDYYLEIASRFINNIHSFNPKQVFSILRVLVFSNYVNFRDLLSSHETIFLNFLKKDSVTGVPSLLLCLSHADLNSNSYLDVLLKLAIENVDKYNNSELVLILFSLIVLNRVETELFIAIFKIIDDLSIDDIKTNNQMLYQTTQIYFELLHNKNFNLSKLIISKDKYNQLRDELIKRVLLPRKNAFSLQNSEEYFNIHETLDYIGIKYIPEYILEIYNIDLALINFDSENILLLLRNLQSKYLDPKPMKKEKLIDENYLSSKICYLEIDGETHFIPFTSKRRGASKLKMRQINHLGYNTIHITKHKCYEISQLKTMQERAKALLIYFDNEIKENSSKLF